MQHDYKVIDATLQEDMVMKIDGYLALIKDGPLLPMQIKYRNPLKQVDDVLMEISYVDSPIEFNGRDYVGKAQLYIQLSCSGEEIRICDADRMKEEGARLARKLLDQGKTKALRNSKGMVMFTQDPHSKRKKIVFFARA